MDARKAGKREGEVLQRRNSLIIPHLNKCREAGGVARAERGNAPSINPKAAVME